MVSQNSYIVYHYVNALTDVFSYETIKDEVVFLLELDLREFAFYPIKTLRSVMTELGIKNLLSFLLTLRKNHRFELLVPILKQLQNKKVLCIETACEHPDISLLKIPESFDKTHIEFSYNPDLLDGFIVEQDDIVYDYSLKTYLKTLMDTLCWK